MYVRVCKLGNFRLQTHLGLFIRELFLRQKEEKGSARSSNSSRFAPGGHPALYGFIRSVFLSPRGGIDDRKHHLCFARKELPPPNFAVAVRRPGQTRRPLSVAGRRSTKKAEDLTVFFFFTFSYAKYTKRKYCNRQKIGTRDVDESPRFRPP
ncbi:hypothetical protein AVEN_110185-1 [Araneus ventricosus]|uniref:Uncharacterized protein n=1 Tax=Araneus ventricosus TaxID=182803 RepID=A0A4Y2VGI5_ARAVE|nr:hypothetical protein AVEN_110185-1 [Araneus ventricosus]